MPGCEAPNTRFDLGAVSLNLRLEIVRLCRRFSGKPTGEK